MANPEPLAKLKDIHLPDPIGWWPLAPGWYVVLLLTGVLAAGIVYYFYKKQQNAQAKNKALALLKEYQTHYLQQHDAALTSARISELLRRVALVYYPRDQVASLHGEEWIAFLNRTGKRIDFSSVQTLLLDLPFKTAAKDDLAPLIQQAERWIKQRGIPC